MRKAPLAYIAILIAFLVNTFGPLPIAQANEFILPKPGTMVHLSSEFNPPMLQGIKVHPNNPFMFDFILDTGDSQLNETQIKDESTKLIKYFLASLTVPEKDLWVNLSPYEKDRIIPESFGLTEMGRDLLAEDYMLKQITASLIYPEDEFGKKFWKRVYEEASKKYNTANIPMNTFNKVWIVPEKAIVYENAQAGTAYVVESRLKVMLEQDYLSLEKHEGITAPVKDKETNQLGSQIVREIVIPELTKEVNEGKNFAQLRQVYNSLVLAVWYKKKIKDSILKQVYIDKNKISGVNINDPQEKQKIYQQYLQAFKKGVYNYIKEEQDPITQQPVPREYFSGGVTFLDSAMVTFVSNTPKNFPSNRNKIIITSNLRILRNDRAMNSDSFQRLKELSYDTGVDETIHSFSNEGRYEDVLAQIRLPSARENTSVHIGVSGIQNLDLMAARFSQWGVLIDINKRTGEFFELIRNIFKERPSISRQDFFSLLMVYLKEKTPTGYNPNYFLNSRMAEVNLRVVLQDKESWLSDDVRYEHIKKMFLENRIVFIRANIADRNLFKGLADWIEQNGAVVDTFYVSNVTDWIKVTNAQDLRANILRVSSNETLILDSANESGVYLAIKSKKDFAMNTVAIKHAFDYQYGQIAVKTDQAMHTSDLISENRNTGGIDFNADKMNLQVQNNNGEIKFKIDPAMFKQLQNV